MRRPFLALAALLALAGPLAAQSDAMTRAFEQERRGNYAGAAEAYAEVLRRSPDNLSALLGLERALTPLRREAELAAPAEALLAASPGSVAGYSVAMRGWAAAGRPDSVAAVAARWAGAEPGSEAPYREWGNTLLAQRDPASARRAYLTGREQLGDPAVLAGELALLAAAENDWETAAREWALAVGRYPGYRLTARNALARTPANKQADVLRQLTRSTPPARRLGAELQVQWGDPADAFTLLMANLPTGNDAVVDALRSEYQAEQMASME
ncbi:MAG TPA: hypothetical protein PK948_06540, partial [Gemmatimonadales bacterium]|nr:hypothetical protein [Gemmatimonadales bacterium]